MNDDIILVDIFDKETGSAEKMEAHRQKKLHRAFSLFVADKHGNMLLQKRAPVCGAMPAVLTRGKVRGYGMP